MNKPLILTYSYICTRQGKLSIPRYEAAHCCCCCCVHRRSAGVVRAPAVPAGGPQQAGRRASAAMVRPQGAGGGDGDDEALQTDGSRDAAVRHAASHGGIVLHDVFRLDGVLHALVLHDAVAVLHGGVLPDAVLHGGVLPDAALHSGVLRAAFFSSCLRK